MSGVNPPPKPPSLGAKPTVPLKPAPAPSGRARRAKPPHASRQRNPPPEPVTQKAAAPKKETARITLPPKAAKPAMPKATIKMQQTQPLVKQPGAGADAEQHPPDARAGALDVRDDPAEAVSDGTVNLLAHRLRSSCRHRLALVFFAYSASALS